MATLSSLSPRTPRTHSSQEEALERTRVKARAASLRVRRAAVNRARHQSELAEAHRRKMDAASANRSSFLERRRTVARRLAAGARPRANDDDDDDGDDDASSPRAPAPSPDAAADSIRRAWLSFRREGGTTEAVASTYRHLGLSDATAAASDDFDAFAGRLSTPSVLRATRAMLTRAQHRLAARGRDRPSAGASTPGAAVTRRRFLAPRSAKENNPNGALDRRDSLDSVDEAFPTRVVLCAYMIVAHPETVLSPGSELRDDENENENENEDEDEGRGGTRRRVRRWGGRDGALHASAGRLVAAVDAMVDIAGRGRRAMSRRDLDAFVAAWDPYLADFCAWKSHDAVALERELVAAAVALETSHLRTCGSDSRSQPFHPSSDEAAVRDAADADKATLRSKVEALGGAAAAARFDDAMASALARVEAEEDEKAEKAADEKSENSSSGDSPEDAKTRRRKERAARRMDARAAIREARTAAFRRRIAARAAAGEPRADDADVVAVAAAGGVANEAMMHELLIDPDWRLAGPSDGGQTIGQTVTASDKPNSHSGRRSNSPHSPTPPSGHEQSLESRVREQMERAFWAQAVESIAAVADVDEPERDAGAARDAGRALAPVAELRAELRSLASARTVKEDAAAIDALRDDAIAPALRSAARNPTTAGDVLGGAMRGAVAMIRRHESPRGGYDKRAADARAEEVERSTAAETAAAVTHSKNGDYPRAARAMARAMTRSLRFCFAELARVRREGANAALAALAPLAMGAEGVRWARHRFATRRRLPEPASSFDADGREKVEVDARAASAALPVTRAWLAAAIPLAHRADASLPRMPSAEEWRRADAIRQSQNIGQNGGHNVGRPASPSAPTPGPSPPAPTPAFIRSGRVHAPRIPAHAERDGEERRKLAKRLGADESLRRAWAPTNASTPEGCVRVALASLIADPNPHDPHRKTLPETLEFDAERLATLQNEFQRIAVSAACVKIARALVRAKTSARDAKIADLADFRRRLDVLLADPTVRVPDLAAEIAARVARSARKPPPTFADAARSTNHDEAQTVDIAAAETELRGLTDPSAPGGAALLDAVRAALATRLLVGPDIAALATVGRDAAAAAAALAAALAAQGLDGEIGVAVAGDVKALAVGAMRSIGRVNWLVHGPTYESVGAELLAEDDEL